MALAVGLRQGEALGLQWEDVDLESGTLRVRHTLQRIAHVMPAMQRDAAERMDALRAAPAG